MSLPKLYTEFADWWPLLSSPEEYAEEAEFYRKTIVAASGSEPRTVLELGSGGGNNASHLKQHFSMRLVDVSPGMLALSRQLNPECEHIEGDMRTVRLNREFDAVFVHDAIDHITTAEELRATIVTAYEHCKPGGVALFVPDYTSDNFRPRTRHGGHDRGNRGLRYLEWDWDPDPGDNVYSSMLVYVMRDGESVRCVEDRFECGLFSRAEWLRTLEEVGFKPRALPFEEAQAKDALTVFLGLKP